MLAAVGGVLYTLATVLKLQGYAAYAQPMPIVVAAMRWGPAAGRKTMTATCCLLLGLLLSQLFAPRGRSSGCAQDFGPVGCSCHPCCDTIPLALFSQPNCRMRLMYGIRCGSQT